MENSKEKFTLAEGDMALMAWKAGQKPNVAFLWLGLLLCGVPMLFQSLSIYKELNRAFPKYDISQSIIKVLFSPWMLLTIDNEMDALAKEIDIELPPVNIKGEIIIIACCVCGLGNFMLPAKIANIITRANVLVKAVADN